MRVGKPKMRTPEPGTERDGELRSQFGALCYRMRDGRLQLLLVTSRGTGRWIIPKGWPVPGATPAESAAQEAWEEAGARGRVSDTCVGVFTYVKQVDGETGLPCAVGVFPLKVRALAGEFPEARDRKRKWVSAKKAAALVDSPELAELIRSFDPRSLPR